MTPDMLCGLTQSHCSTWIDSRVSPAKPWLLNRDAIAAWEAMLKAAADDGLMISPLSTFRDFSRQRVIWNEKFNGVRTVHNEQNQVLRKQDFDQWTWAKKILRYSALPGLSRHHWGSEIDVFDGHALQNGVQAQLQADEFCANGPCYSLDTWLQQHALHFGFYRPYRSVNNGVAPEPWHLSYIPVARIALHEINTERLRDLLSNNDIAGLDVILPRLEQIITAYALGVDPIP